MPWLRVWYDTCMAFFFRQPKRSHIAIDLGSHAIKAAIFEKPVEGMVPDNIRKLVKKLNVTSRGSQSCAGLSDLLSGLLKQQKRAPEKIIIGIGPNNAHITLHEWTVDSAHAREMLTPSHIQKYFQDLFNEHREETHASLGYPIAVEINGYPVNIHSLASYDPSSVREITLRTIMLEFEDKAGLIFGELKQMFSGIEIELIPLPAATAEVLGITCHINDGILIDVGGSSTEVMFMHNAHLLQLSSFPVGSDRFSHRIVKTTGGKFVEAEDLTRQYSHGLISKDEQMELSHIFSEEAIKWKKEFINALEAYYPIAPIPEDFYLYGGGSYLPEVRSALWSRDIVKKFSAFESPRVHIIQAPQIFNNDSLIPHIRGPEDVGLASLMYYSLHHKPLF